MNKNVPTVFVTRHGARIAMSGAEAEELRSRSVVSRPDPGRAPAVYHPEGGRKLEEVGAELALLRAGSAEMPALFETAYVLAVPRGGRTLYLDGEGERECP